MKICRAPDCKNLAIKQRTVCTKHKHRIRKGSFDLQKRISKSASFSNNIVKICKIHGELEIDQTYLQYSKYKQQKYKYYSCKKCISLKKQRLYYLNVDKYRKYGRAQRKKHYEKCIKRDRAYKLKLLVSETQFNLLVEKQKNLCAICNKPETSKNHNSRNGTIKEIKSIKRLAIDHCHKTGKVRGLLCHRCNTALGSFRDSIELLQAAITYLQATT